MDLSYLCGRKLRDRNLPLHYPFLFQSLDLFSLPEVVRQRLYSMRGRSLPLLLCFPLFIPAKSESGSSSFWSKEGLMIDGCCWMISPPSVLPALLNWKNQENIYSSNFIG